MILIQTIILKQIQNESFIFSGRYNGHHIPLVWVLTSYKDEETYNTVFEELKKLQPMLNPTDVTLDFEMATMNAVRTNFPMAELHACNFHFGQNLWRHLQHVGLQTEYQNNPDFALQIKMILALAFVPSESVTDAFIQLSDTEFFSEDNSTSPHYNAIQTFLSYFQTTYIFRMDKRGNRQQPLFPPPLWNVYDTTLAGKVPRNLKKFKVYSPLCEFSD